MNKRTPGVRAAPAERGHISPKKKWVAPAIARIAAGDAENGPNPGLTDGAFTLS